MSILEAYADGIRGTALFRHLPAMTRASDLILAAHHSANLALRLPLHHTRLVKKRPKDTAFEGAIQAGLAIIAAHAKATSTRQVIVSLARAKPVSASYQPRPQGLNWTAEYAISPSSEANNYLLDENDDRTAPELANRTALHLANRTATAIVLAEGGPYDGVVTFMFDNYFMTPRAEAIWRPYEANAPGSHRSLLLP